MSANSVAVLVGLSICDSHSKTPIAVWPSVDCFCGGWDALITADSAYKASLMVEFVSPNVRGHCQCRKLAFAVLAHLCENKSIGRTVKIVVMDEKVIPNELFVALAALEVFNVPKPTPVLSVRPKDHFLTVRASTQFNFVIAVRTHKSLGILCELPEL
jgi:hypothetical protein